MRTKKSHSTSIHIFYHGFFQEILFSNIQSLIDSFIQSSWKSTFNECSLEQFVKEIPGHGVYSPLTNGNPYRANKLCELFIGNSLKLPYYAWDLSKIASPLCTCGKEEGDSLHYFLRCANNEPARPSNIKDLTVLPLSPLFARQKS